MGYQYSFWSELTTINGFRGDEIISTLQKSIRRAMVEEACECAYELYITSPLLLDKMWRRLIAISVEDIGFGDLSMPGQIHTLNQLRKEFPYDDGDQPIFFIHAIRIMCDSKKDRSSDLLKNIIIKGFAMGRVPTVMDVALDKHTKKGIEMGRGSMHFFTEGTKVTPELEVENDYKACYKKIIETYDPKNNVKTAFKYGTSQY